MQYTENDLKDGMKLICTQDGGFDWWTKGGIYTVANKCIIDNFGDSVESWYILDSLNNECSFVKFEIFEYPVERQNIFDKMERMDRQEVKLRDKINKLKEAKKALEILKEFK